MRLGLFLLITFAVIGCSRDKQMPTETHADRIKALESQVEAQRVSSQEAVETYQPKEPGGLDDLGTNAPDILRQLPGVASVEVLVVAEKPTHRIIQLRDWHVVPLDLYALDLRQAAGRNVSDEEIRQRHQGLLLEAELVQMDQEALLRCLVRHHGLKRVLAEGLTPGGVENYWAVMAALGETDRRLAEC